MKRNVTIKGLNVKEVELLLSFMEERLNDDEYVSDIELCGNDCNMDWMIDGLEIGDDDMVYSLFEIYGIREGNTYSLKIENVVFTTIKDGCDWVNEYLTIK